jgi:ABC-type multidrug transport system fused ATPase/permease subunit
LRYGKPFWLQLTGAVSLLLFASVSVLLSAKTLGELAQTFVSGGRQESLIYKLAAIILALEIAHVVLLYFGRISLSYVTNFITFQIRRDLFRKITALPISYFDKQPLGRTITRLTSDIEGIEKFFSGPLSRVVNATITIASVLVAMLITDLKIGLVVVLASVPAIMITLVTRKPVIHWLRQYKIRSSELNSKTAEYLNGFPVIKIYGLESWSFKNYDKLNHDVLSAGISITNWNSFIRPVASFLCAVPIVVVLWLGGGMVLQGTLAIGVVVAFVRYAERIFRPVLALSQEIHVIQDAIASSERVQIMLSEPEETASLGPSGQHRAPLEGRIEYKNVWMEYHPDLPVLQGIDFHIEPGMSVGLVGETGSGKTTVVNLIPQLYPKRSGEILVDGVRIEDWDRENLRSQIGMVGQDIIIFQGTLRDNLIVARSKDQSPLTDDEVIGFCDLTGLSAVMDRLSGGLDFKILEGGDNLSVGEKQLIALTRMLIKNPGIFILDEATANIDPNCEKLIQQAIATLLKGRTCFVIAHRLNTILKCDKILVFRQGKIVETGTHESLMKKQGYYASLATAQLMLAKNGLGEDEFVAKGRMEITALGNAPVPT